MRVVEVIDGGAEELERGLVILRAGEGTGRAIAVIGQFLDGVADDHAEAVADAGAGDAFLLIHRERPGAF